MTRVLIEPAPVRIFDIVAQSPVSKIDMSLLKVRCDFTSTWGQLTLAVYLCHSECESALNIHVFEVSVHCRLLKVDRTGKAANVGRKVDLDGESAAWIHARVLGCVLDQKLECFGNVTLNLLLIVGDRGIDATHGALQLLDECTPDGWFRVNVPDGSVSAKVVGRGGGAGAGAGPSARDRTDMRCKDALIGVTGCRGAAACPDAVSTGCS